MGSLFIGNNPNAKQVKGLGFSEAHSDTNYNINNLKFINDGSINKENYNLLKRIYPNTNGNRELNNVKEGK
ncbi:putative heme transporter CcmA [Actinobacillus pleuropneumoniae]|uniref:hypothetical protein n=1 Tax=Actinobacillus pleuropneumoniae TaxID=715 RepID=UPI000584A3C1|nr:hypothetical protein [Actinobacillus pleuropneumoniae]UKH37026.1 heme transporter CcmA [Actinobacillus pleuropneumoniae serovar 8 str. 405]KIE91097.1 putative heme transporter CcmA [Actinobacillus pleuropneumoniae]KIE91401.1 putative heme transporter CcmA [Actinobacillus pleuropneumoniae]KIE91561.1 putative heme transporter CcmA [Actinobacillus pleuropneumoniae]KIE96672.1 putative heme transporter CcmA [Actinobacillus pleuropneumoniae]